MLLARVAGTLVATDKEPSLEGLSFRVLSQLNTENEETGSYVVAVDAIGAGVGEVVMYATGSSARQTIATDGRPCDAVVMAIVDTWEVDGEEKYHK
ncbi:MAG: EutN/CcmL family microcompartment protein [Acidimicrobiia bacterium]|nr:EutN/CcmL family microcompartment protein [Acidimicrobiia bacterium]MBT8193386.1 EutN/CcmL family microcompartment protein [Acidimicrobiia bacterium]MBT8248487.1 EutN/CcmL family microcompartment protein [Acidimicrobiia bacterium]NNF89300.1 EutN/CcmL family microcompartment protein [Acidimicrobiia bacterium]NNJ47609.1 EutN/CcmL family microcompartment protein [Acidimicrobiia bacterium]